MQRHPIVVASVFDVLAACVTLSVCLGLSACADDESLSQTVPLMSVAVEQLVFPDTYVGGPPSTRTVTVTSNGTGQVEGLAAAIADAIEAPFSIVNDVPTELDPGQPLEVVVSYAPLEAGTDAGRLVITGQADNVQRIEVQLLGRGIPTPGCDDGNDCTVEYFDYLLATCVRTDRAGACDDHSACTVDDECIDGQCKGTDVSATCHDDVGCTIDTCDPQTGCRFVPDDGACADDGNPCTSERCDPIDGCQRSDAADGTPCGAYEQCVQAQVCIWGECRSFDVPDGWPCNDGDVCTVDDVCQDRVCGGQGVTSDPEVVSSLPMFGLPGGQVVMLADGSMAFVDRVVATSNPSGVFWGDWDALVTITSAGLEVAGRLRLRGDPGPAWPAPGGLAVVISDPDGCPAPSLCPYRLKTLAVSDGGSLALALDSELPDFSWLDRWAAGGSRAVFCRTQEEITVLELVALEDLQRLDLTLPAPADCGHRLAITPNGDRIVLYGTIGGLSTLALDGASLHVLAHTPLATLGMPARGLAVRQDAILVAGSYRIDGGSDRGDGIHLLDLESHAWLGSLTEGVPLLTLATGAALGSRWAGVVLTEGESWAASLLQLDVGEPAAMRVVDRQLLPFNYCTWCPTPALTAGAAPERVVLMPYYAPPAIYDASSAGLAFRTRAGHGGSTALVTQSGTAWALGTSTIQRAALGADLSLTWLDGGLLPAARPAAWWVVPGDTTALALDAQATPYTHLARSSTGQPGLTVLSAVAPYQPLEALRSDELYLVGRQRGGLLDAVIFTYIDPTASGLDGYSWDYAVLALDAIGREPYPLTRERSVTLDVAALYPNLAGVYDYQCCRIGAAPDGSLVAVSFSFWNPFQEVLFLAAGAGGDLAIVAADTFERNLRDLGVLDGHVLGLQAADPNYDVDWKYDGQSLLAFAPDGAGGLVETSRLAMPESGMILLVAPPLALVSTRAGLAFIRLDGGTLEQTYFLPLDETPQAVALDGDHLVLRHEAALKVAYPPCAPR